MVLLNLPLIGMAILGAYAAYKTGVTTKKQLWVRIIFWLLILLGLATAEPLYRFLFSNDLTRTEPLSLFDVIQITGIIYVLQLASRAYSKVDLLERQIHQMHRDYSIQLSKTSRKK